MVMMMMIVMIMMWLLLLLIVILGVILSSILIISRILMLISLRLILTSVFSTGSTTSTVLRVVRAPTVISAPITEKWRKIGAAVYANAAILNLGQDVGLNVWTINCFFWGWLLRLLLLLLMMPAIPLVVLCWRIVLETEKCLFQVLRLLMVEYTWDILCREAFMLNVEVLNLYSQSWQSKKSNFMNSWLSFPNMLKIL